LADTTHISRSIFCQTRMLSSQKTLPDLDLSKLPTTLDSSSILFRIPVDDRNDDENEAVVSLLSGVPYLREISQTADKPNQFLLETSKLFQHEIYSKGQAIGHYGDNPRKFWVILKGDVRIYTPKALEDYFSQGTDEVLNDMSPTNPRYPESTKGSFFNLDSPLLGSISPISRTNTKFLLEKKSTIFFEAPSGSNSPARKFSDASSVVFEGRKSPAKQGTKQVFFDFGGSIIEEETKDVSRLGGRVRRPTRLTASSSTVPPQIEEFGIFKRLNMNKKYFTSEDVFKFQFDKVYKSGNCFADLETDPYLPLPVSLIAWEEVHVISMPMKNYTKQLRKLNRVLTENLNILDSLFPELPERVLLPLATSLEKKTFYKGDVMYQEGSESSDLYIIQQGEVELMKNVANDSSQSSPKLKPRRGKKEKRKILLLSENQIFGEESVLDYESNQFTARVRSLELTVYVLPKTLMKRTAKRFEHFLPAISQKAMVSFKVKCMRESEMPTETQVVSKIFENPTRQEKKDKQYVKNALDYYTRLLLQEKSPKGNVSSSHIRSGDRESPTRLSQEHSQELQKLADLKTKMIRNKVKVDPRFELEESSPTFQAKRKEADEKIWKSMSSKPSYSKFENQMPISLWNRGLEGSMFSKRLKALQASRKTKDNKSMKLSHDYGQSLASPFHSRTASLSGPIKTKVKREESQSTNVLVHNVMNIESLVSEHAGDSLISEGIEKTIKKEIENMISSKLSENKKEPKVKPDKIKKGLACLQPERENSFHLKNWDTESGDESFVPIGSGRVKFTLNSPKQGACANFEIEKGNKKSKLMKGFRESNNRKSMLALAEYFKGSVYDSNTSQNKNFEESVLSLKKMESMPMRRMLSSEIQGKGDHEDLKGRQTILPSILTTKLQTFHELRRVKSKSPVVNQRNK